MPSTRTGASSQPFTDTPITSPRRTTRSYRKKVHWADQLADRLEKEAQSTAMKKGKKGASRRPPPKPVRLTWGPSTVIPRAGMNYAYRLWESHQKTLPTTEPTPDPITEPKEAFEIALENMT